MHTIDDAKKRARISIVVALGRGRLHNRVIGKDNQLLWHIPDDLKRFKALTLGHPVIMGRKTFESILAVIGKPLPGRTNIVVTRQHGYAVPGATVAHSLIEAIGIAEGAPGGEEIFIGGGGELYKEALPFVSKLYLTLIDDEKEGDSYFPPYEEIFTKKIFEEPREWDGLTYRWIDLER